MDISWTLTGDGLLAFAGGALALFGVWWSNHQSIKNLEKQLVAEQTARTQAAERQRRAIATAILYEIDSFYTVELDLVEKNLANWDCAGNNFPTAVGIRTNISEIYRAVSPLLGSLNANSVSAIVKFYTAVAMYEGNWRDYQYCLEMLRAPVNPDVNLNPQNLVNEAKRQLKSIRDSIPHLKSLAGSVTQRVAHDCGLEGLIGRSNAQTH